MPTPVNGKSTKKRLESYDLAKERKIHISKHESELQPFTHNANDHVRRMHLAMEKQSDIHENYATKAYNLPNLAEFERQRNDRSNKIVDDNVARY